MKHLLFPLILLAGCDRSPSQVVSSLHRSQLAVPAERDGCSQKGILVTVASLEQEPQIWGGDTFTISNPNVSIWVANEAYGLEIDPQKGGKLDVFTPPCRALLYKATQEWAEKRVS